jgi:hypothetical protein
VRGDEVLPAPRRLAGRALPALFAAHQFLEGFVWLALQDRVPQLVGDASAHAYILYAQGVLPILVPLAILLLEPSPRRRKVIAPFLAVGVATGTYLFWIDAAHPITYRIVNNSINYVNTGSLVGLFAVL